jgi:hypothetical protein
MSDWREQRGPTPTRLAATELQTCVAKISGALLPIRAEPSADVPVQIYVGESPHAAKLGVTADRLEHGAYRIASGEKWLALIGEDTDFTPKELWARRRLGITRAHYGEFGALGQGSSRLVWSMQLAQGRI